ncbi:MAG: secondary thiamine-phosphate synthase enzyme YjbQ [Melioribacteraceae bacterium]|nr:secondary thiamine-phosphate synthase enzyme YjbQ [Melioribacteraceae bacterium]MCF8412154.1 secondary thiamine-phosphate synthase enzyme YjbQ [Melioribacteraceae bacterium]MCF8431834.1 secondary thiamine-phosphate synthase enzyme YjbQ [Melioribacteraceae bacterium]
MFYQKEISLRPYPRGFHIITREIENTFPELKRIKMGLCNVFIKHTSASLTINENVSPDVRVDMESHFNKMVAENSPYFTHTYEGPDDMPAHIKASILGQSLTVPVTNGKFNLGTWQGIYLCEHRDYGGARQLVVTISGE